MSFRESEIIEPVKSTLVEKGWRFDTEVITHLDGFTDVGVDVVLYIQRNLPIAVIEFRNENLLQNGIEKAKRYAQPLNVMYTFATDGHQLFFHEQIGELEIKSKLRLSDFPTKDFLWQLYCSYHKYGARQRNLITHPYYSINETQPRDYQVEAINSISTAIAKGQQRMLMVMAQGTGKNYVTFQIVWRLIQSSFSKRVLILFDRQEQLLQARVAYQETFDGSVSIIKGKRFERGYTVYLGLYQTLMATELGETQKAFQQIDNDYFDVIIADECHRSVSQSSTWYELLNYFSYAIKIGVTPTPISETIDYFGSIVFNYDMAQSIEDGNATSARLVQITKTDESGETLSAKRINFVAQQITTYLQSHDPMAKTIVFCESIKHAEYMRKSLVQLNQDEVKKDSRYITKFTHEDKSNLRALDDFKDSNSTYPVIAVTVNILAKGIDVPTCQLIVIDREIESSTLMLQMISRGTRNIKRYEKSEFTVLDFSNSTKRHESILSRIIKEIIKVDTVDKLTQPVKNPQSFNEARVVALGDINVGKTPLFNQLKNEANNKYSDVKGNKNIRIQIDDYQLNIWSFESFNMVQDIGKLFLTPNTLYLYVIDHKDIGLLNRIDYWLSLIKERTANSPILVLINTPKNVEPINFNVDRLKNDFNIVGCISIPLSSKLTETLKSEIVKNIQTLPSIKTSYPASWHQIKRALFAIDKSGFTKINFEEVCESHGVSDANEMLNLLNELTCLGRFIFYQQGNKLNEIAVIDPKEVLAWMRLESIELNDSINGLLLGNALLERTLGDFPLIHNGLLTKFLSEYQLLFKLNETHLIYPFLLPSLPANLDMTPYQQGINYRLKYQLVTPDSIICRLAVKLQPYIEFEKESLFRQAIFLTFEDATALILIDEVNRNIDIAVNTTDLNAKQLLALIVNSLREINGVDTKVTEQIALVVNDGNVDKAQLLHTKASQLGAIDIDETSINLPTQLLANFEQWEFQLLLKIHKQLEENPVIEIQQQLPDLKREFTGFKVPLIDFIAHCADNNLLDQDMAFTHAQLASDNLHYLSGSDSLCNQLTQRYAQGFNQWPIFVAQFNQIIENYNLPQALLLDEI